MSFPALDELLQYILARSQNDLRTEFDVSLKTAEHLHILDFPGGELNSYRREDVRAALEGRNLGDAPALPRPSPRDPRSVGLFFRVLLHELMEQNCVLFTRSAAVLGMACAREGRQAVERLLGQTLWVPVLASDEDLVSEATAQMRNFRQAKARNPQAVLFQNQGICLASGTQEGMKEWLESFFRGFTRRERREPDFSAVEFDSDRAVQIAPAVRVLLGTGRPGSIVAFHANRELGKYICMKACFDEIAAPAEFDQLAACNAYPAWIPYRAELDEQFAEIRNGIAGFIGRHGLPPRLVAVEKLGMYAWGPDKAGADRCWEVFQNSLRIAAYAESLGGRQPLPAPMVQEALRKKRESEGAQDEDCARRVPRFGGKIAIVTGSARGIGAGIAEKLAAEGGNVVLADIAEREAVERAEEICRAHGRKKACGRAVDVGEEPSVKALVAATVLEYGGLDILVSNAGIVRAGSIEDLDRDAFDQVTRINYTAFFLCCKHAARIMKIQHSFDPSGYADIVLINSKSGLIGSRSNFAYAGSKFGGIGLVQSFALELVDSNIKVNAICPGNYLEGPLWSDPANGLLVQYLKAKKVAGAKSVEEVRRYYESEMPMKRGCRIEDIFRAVAYVIEQNYETGQAVPVTGGQMMLK
jgi:NAD(P)-dependent dehydrogenase (short-subunit alcohol dehydrogenase family)